MSRLIDADEAIDYVNDIITVHRFYHPRSTTENFPISEVIAKINEVPTVDAVPVVRCKNCKYSEPYDGSTKATLRLKCLYRSGVLENWFCEHGERR